MLCIIYTIRLSSAFCCYILCTEVVCLHRNSSMLVLGCVTAMQLPPLHVREWEGIPNAGPPCEIPSLVVVEPMTKYIASCCSCYSTTFFSSVYPSSCYHTGQELFDVEGDVLRLPTAYLFSTPLRSFLEQNIFSDVKEKLIDRSPYSHCKMAMALILTI